ncbi:MAG: ferritin-like domain-containing protein [Rhodospirillaceae bacterium]
MMKSVEVFLAHAVALEQESADRFDELADTLEVHHNGEVTELFRKMAHFSRLHLAEAKSMVGPGGLPHIKPWEFQWPGEEAPETVDIEGTHYKMTPWHALTLALESEKTGYDFYASVAESTDDVEIEKLAKEFAEEEAEHVAMLETMIAKFPEPKEGWDEDMDPPAVVD